MDCVKKQVRKLIIKLSYNYKVKGQIYFFLYDPIMLRVVTLHPISSGRNKEA